MFPIRWLQKRYITIEADLVSSNVSNQFFQLVFGNCGIISSNQHFDGKGYVEMTGLDGDTSQDIADAIVSKGGRYLEAQIQGSRIQSEEGTLIILAAGDRTLFDECQSCFKAMGKSSFFLGDIGNASKMYLILQMLAGVTLGGLAEALALGELNDDMRIRIIIKLYLLCNFSGQSRTTAKRCS